jgi:multidrug efflux pump subunit AcrB
MQKSQTGLIAWFARRPMYANTLMLFLVISGLLSFFSLQRELIPKINLNTIKIDVSYPGASPREMETQVVQKIEHKINSIEAIKYYDANASEGAAYLTLHLKNDADMMETLDKVKSAVDEVSDFPDNANNPKIYQGTVPISAILFGLTGDLPAMPLQMLAENIKEELEQLPNVSKVDILGQQAYEVNIEVDAALLERYQLSLSDLTNAIKHHQKTFSGGVLKTEQGNLAIQSQDPIHNLNALGQVPIKMTQTGHHLVLADVAQISNGFTEDPSFVRFNGKPSLSLVVYGDERSDIIDLAQQIKQHMAQKVLPETVTTEVIFDWSEPVESRLNMMHSNLLYGALLIFIVLAVFLELKLAAWVMLGLPVCFLAAISFMPLSPFNISLNMLSMFGFLIVIGVLVDDAIVIGESIHSSTQKYGHSIDHVILGAKKVATPATFGVLTTIAAFAPFLFSEGARAKWMFDLAGVVILCLIFSLIESKLILPAHLAHSKPTLNKTGKVYLAQQKFNQGFNRWIQQSFRGWVQACVAAPYRTTAVFVGVLLVCMSLFTSGLVRFEMDPDMDLRYTQISLEMNSNTAYQTTHTHLLALDQSLQQLEDQLVATYGHSPIKSILLLQTSNTYAEVQVNLVDETKHPMATAEFEKQWRQRLPELTEVKKLTLGSSESQNKSDVAFNLNSTNSRQTQLAVAQTKALLKSMPGVFEINDNLPETKDEIRLSLTDLGRMHGLTIATLASKVREAMYGQELNTLFRNSEEIKLQLRYLKAQRQQLNDLKTLRINLESQWLPLTALANISIVQGASVIRHHNGKQTAQVTAKIDPKISNQFEVMNHFMANIKPQIERQYPEVEFKLGQGSIEAQQQVNEQIKFMGIACLLIYVLLALPLQSFSKPMIIMSVIPFSLIGVILGHWLIDINISMLSILGIIALSGIVVNDSLVMSDCIHQLVEKGTELKQAVVDAACLRFRAIFLTTMTTSAGLLPILLETSIQAKFVIPMAVSVAFGIMSATFVTLFLIPAWYVIGADSRRLLKWWWQPTPSKATKPL